MTKQIPFNSVYLSGSELGYIEQVLSKKQISGNGLFTKRCETLLEEQLGVQRVLLTTSCTHALEMAALLIKKNSGDEVIVPSFTFVSTVNAFVLHGYKPIFIDICPDTLNLDQSQLEQLITPRTGAIVPVHYAGVGCNMDTIIKISSYYQIPVIEDNAHGLFGKFKGQFLGTFGPLATLSFHQTKNLTCGEGGALLINDSDYIKRAEIIRNKGTDYDLFLKGDVSKYTWQDIGSSYLLSEILAAFLYAQLESREKIFVNRYRSWNYYNKYLKDWANINDTILPTIPSKCESSYHLYYMILPSLKHRQKLMAVLNNHGITSTFHYQPLHLSTMGKKWGYKLGDFPITEKISSSLIRLPLYNELSLSDQEYIVDVITKIKW
jgi:dTDP-4-amino-4,6-dideoxygalactose transaminase